MPYIVTNSDGSLTVTVQDSVVDTSTYSLALIGRNVSNFGQYFAQNTIRHLENFASSTAPSPSSRLVGQLWFDKTENILRVWDGSNWKRATGTIVGPVGDRPTSGLGGGGAQFFNTTTGKLEVYNGSKFVEAGYPGEITTASADPDNPSLHGTKLRSIFLTDTSGRKHPVMALSYVKSSGTNQGSTQIGTAGQYETIMAIFSDEEFTLSTTSTGTTIDGVSVSHSNIYAELTGTGGIAAARSGRNAGVILPGMNIRSEYESASVSAIENLYANTIGSSGDPVSTAHIQELTVINSLDINSSANVSNDLDVGGSITVGGDVTAATGMGTFANLVVSANTTLSGVTNINGTINVNGVNTQTLGSDAQKIETYFGNTIDVQTITVDDTATVTNLTAANITCTNSIGANDVTASGVTELAVTNINGTLTANGAVDINNTVNVQGVSTFQSAINAPGQTITASVFAGAVSQVNITATNDNSTNYLAFVDGSSGGQDVEVDTDFTYNPSTGLLSGTSTTMSGTIQGGTITDGTASLTGGALTGVGSITTLGTITGTTLTDGTLSTNSGTITGGVGATFSGTVTAGTFSDGSATLTGGVLTGTATQAQYADLAEIYASDADYEPGTVVKLGGEKEITQTTSHNDTEVFGVISTDPAYLMNKDAEGLPVALTGRVPVKVIGKVKKGERLISSDIPGVAWALANEAYDARAVIGRSLEDKQDGDTGVVEAVIGVK